MSIEIRSATPSDVAAIQRVARRTWHASYDDILGPEHVDAVVDDWYGAEGLRSAVTDDAQPFLVAVGDDGIRGFAHTGPHPEREAVRVLYRIYVDPDHWGRGLGSRLLRETEARLADATRLELGVLAANDRARRFYEARGFEQIDTGEATLDGVTVAECTYAKPL